MDSINFWYKQHISGQKIGFCLLLIILTCSAAHAQFGKHSDAYKKNLKGYDDKWLHYGFTLGLNYTQFRVRHSDYFINRDTVNQAVSNGHAGFNLGFIVNLRLGDYFDLRLMPMAAFYQRTIQYNLKGDVTKDQTKESTFIELPLILKYKSERRLNRRMYFVGGIKPSFEASARTQEPNPELLRNKIFDFAVVYGFGIDLYMPLFKFSPELRFSHGISNVVMRDENVYSRSLDKLTTHTVSLYLHFE